jgi:ornithine carbamoyltransferase
MTSSRDSAARTWSDVGARHGGQDFAAFAVDARLVAAAPRYVKIMHCLPVCRGCEITDEVAESPNSIMFDQAENRLHFQRAFLKKLMA